MLHSFCGTALWHDRPRLWANDGRYRAAKRVIDVLCASISAFEVFKVVSESHFFVHEEPKNTFYKLAGVGFVCPVRAPRHWKVRS